LAKEIKFEKDIVKEFKLGELFCGPGEWHWEQRQRRLRFQIIRLFINGQMIMIKTHVIHIREILPR